MPSPSSPKDVNEPARLEAVDIQWWPYATSPTSSQRDPLLPVTSHFLSPKTLCVVRLCLSAYSLSFMIFYLWNEIDHGRTAASTLVYFTNLTFFAEVGYIWASTFHSYNYVYNPRTAGRPPPPFEAFPVLLRLHAWLYTTVAVFHIVVPIVYWPLLSSYIFNGTAGVGDTLGSVGTHAIDFAMMAVEVTFSRNVVRKSHWRVVSVVFCLYVLLAFTNYWGNGWFVYSFIDYTKQSWYFWYLAIIILFIIVFMGQVYLHRLRDRIGYQSAHRLLGTEKPLAMTLVSPSRLSVDLETGLGSSPKISDGPLAVVRLSPSKSSEELLAIQQV